jgi:hypothetical protein
MCGYLVPAMSGGNSRFIDLYDTYQKKVWKSSEWPAAATARRRFWILSRNMASLSIALLTQEFLDGFGGINAIPTTFLIDKGNLVKTYVFYREKEVLFRT